MCWFYWEVYSRLKIWIFNSSCVVSLHALSHYVDIDVISIFEDFFIEFNFCWVWMNANGTMHNQSFTSLRRVETAVKKAPCCQRLFMQVSETPSYGKIMQEAYTPFDMMSLWDPMLSAWFTYWSSLLRTASDSWICCSSVFDSNNCIDLANNLTSFSRLFCIQLVIVSVLVSWK